MNDLNIESFVWNICDDVLRGLFKRHEYGDIILPFLVLRRLDCVLEKNKDEIIKIHEEFKDKFEDTSNIIHSKLNLNYSNFSRYDLNRIINEPSKIYENLYDYLKSFSSNVQEIIQNFGLEKHIEKLQENESLYILIEKFTHINLHPSSVDNHIMGTIFEKLLRKFSEMSNETSGEHYTPRDIVNLLVSLVFIPEKEELSKPNKIISIYDPCCGTGGMLTIGKKWIQENISEKIEVNMFGQELNPQTYSICKSDFLITNEQPENIKLGSTLSNDGFNNTNRKFDYMICNPPYGVSWKKDEKFVKDESKQQGSRFSIGTPRVSDGQFLFLQHMISKMENERSRIGIVFNGSTMFTGDSGSGESEIRKWIIENDMLETIVQLPDRMFFNTGITTYLWILTNKKETRRKGKIQLIDVSKIFTSMRKNLGDKGKEITDGDKEKILKTYLNFENNDFCKILDNKYFGYTRVQIEQPIYENGLIKKDKSNNPKPNTKLRDYERIPLTNSIDDYYDIEVKPYLPDSWMDRSKDKIGYELNFLKTFFKFENLRNLDEIENDLLKLENEIQEIKL